MADYSYLIVGGGMTADAAVRGIRERDAKGSVAVFGAESHPPYNRPPLTKALWKGEPEQSIWRGAEPPGVTLHLGRRVTTLDRRTKSVVDSSGTTHRYEKLLLATGGTPRRLPNAPDDVIYYRTLDDYRRLRELAASPKRFLVIGGGFIGSEVAAALCMQGREVEMLVPEAGIGARIFPADLSRAVSDYYKEKGVQLHVGESAASLERRAGRVTARTTKGRELTADAAVLGLGIQPNIELAERAGLRCDNGILVDEFCRTDDQSVFAAGDVANFFNPALNARLRVEHEDNANTMGKAAGRNMVTPDEPYRHLPFFYSDLFELGYEAVGELDARHEVVSDWKQPFREGVVYYLAAGRVRGVLLWNTWGKVDAARALIAEAGPMRATDVKGKI